MYEYKYVKLEIKGIVFSKLDAHGEIISKHAKEGWRFIQILPVKYGNTGYPMEFEIIFERKVDNV